MRVKQEPLSQIEHELSNSDPTRSRRETYDAPATEGGIGHSSESKGDLITLCTRLTFSWNKTLQRWV